MCTVLDKALYRLWDSPALWNKAWTNSLKSQGLIPCKEDSRIYMDLERKIFVVFYVNDILVLSHKRNAVAKEQIVKEIKKSFELQSMGEAKWFLRVRIVWDQPTGKLWLVHDTYIKKVANWFNLSEGKTSSTPLLLHEFKKNSGQTTPVFTKIY